MCFEETLDIFTSSGGMFGRPSINCFAACCCYLCKPLERAGYMSPRCWAASTVVYILLGVVFLATFVPVAYSFWAGTQSCDSFAVDDDRAGDDEKIRLPFDCSPTPGSDDDEDKGLWCCSLPCDTNSTSEQVCQWNGVTGWLIFALALFGAFALLGLLTIVSGAMLCDFKRRRDRDRKVIGGAVGARDDGRVTAKPGVV